MACVAQNRQAMYDLLPEGRRRPRTYFPHDRNRPDALCPVLDLLQSI
jgi:hypothetical protein